MAMAKISRGLAQISFNFISKSIAQIKICMNSDMHLYKLRSVHQVKICRYPSFHVDLCGRCKNLIIVIIIIFNILLWYKIAIDLQSIKCLRHM